MLKKLTAALVVVSFLNIGSFLSAGGNHFGEFKDLGLNIEYFDYAYKLPNGEPVYYIGSNMRYRITLKNNGNRTYKNFQSKSTLRWIGSTSCTRYWYDNQHASYIDGTPMPGNSTSGLRSADMRKRGMSSYDVNYHIPLTICPGRGEVVVEGRHRNNSGREEVASYTIPLNIHMKRKK